MDYTEKWGKDIEEAVSLALIDLKVSREEVEVTVLEEPTKGFLGLGAKLAKVRVEKIKKEEPKPEVVIAPEKEVSEKKTTEKKAPEKKSSEKKSQSRKSSKAKAKKPEEKKANIVLDDVDINDLTVVEEHEALTFLKDITEKMGLDLNYSARVGEDLV